MHHHQDMFDRVSLQRLTLPLSLIAIWSFFGLLADEFLSARNLSMLAIELSVTATLAIGMLIVILPGQIDLAAGSGVGFVGGLSAVLVFHHQWDAAPALLVGIAAGMAVWFFMAWIITKLQVQAFIVTLGGLLVIRGCFWLLIGSSATPVSYGGTTNLYQALTTSYLPPVIGLLVAGFVACAGVAVAVRDRRKRLAAGLEVDPFELFFLKSLVAVQIVLLVVLTCNLFRGLPLPLVVLSTLAVYAHYFTSHTVFGRYLYAIGGNAPAAFACGVPLDASILKAFAFMGFCVAVTGFLQTSYVGAATTTTGELMELDAIAACVIGGASLRGGRGTVAGTLGGALVMASLLNGLTLMAVAPEIKLVVRGTVLVVAVIFEARFRQRES